MMGCSGEGEGARGGALRFDSPKTDMKLFRSPAGCGRLTCIAIGTETAAPPSELPSSFFEASTNLPGRSVAVTIASCSSSAVSMRANFRA